MYLSLIHILALVDDKKVNEKRLKELGAAGLVKLGDGGVQVIFGGKSQILRDEIKTVMSRPRPTEMTVACANYVSYTHLDVYKRQSGYRSTNPRWFWNCRRRGWMRTNPLTMLCRGR